MSGLDFVGYVFGGLMILGALVMLGTVLWICFSPKHKRARTESEARSKRIRREIDEERQPRPFRGLGR